MNWRAWSVRERLDKANGNHDNQVIWAFVGPGRRAQPGAALGLLSFTTLDEWLANVEADTAHFKVEDKVRAGKPLTAIDRCLTTNGATDAQIAANIPLDAPDVPGQVPGLAAAGRGRAAVRERLQVPDEARSTSTSPDYDGVAFTAEQQARLAAVFPTGVCNWSKPGVEPGARRRLDDVQERPGRPAARPGTRLGRGLAQREGDGGAARGTAVLTRASAGRRSRAARARARPRRARRRRACRRSSCRTRPCRSGRGRRG